MALISGVTCGRATSVPRVSGPGVPVMVIDLPSTVSPGAVSSPGVLNISNSGDVAWQLLTLRATTSREDAGETSAVLRLSGPPVSLTPQAQISQPIVLRTDRREAAGILRIIIVCDFAGPDGSISSSTASTRVVLTGDAPIPTGSRLVVARDPAWVYVNSPFGVQPRIALVNSDGNPVDSPGVVELLVSMGAGNLIGTRNAPLIGGTATFTDVGYDRADTRVVLRASIGDRWVNLAPFDVAADPEGACIIDDTFFHTMDGGCRDESTGLVWSAVADTELDLGAAVWDSTRNGASMPDAWDFARTNDYGPGMTSTSPYLDTAYAAYCHDLSEGGQSDWRLPSITDLASLAPGTGPESAVFHIAMPAAAQMLAAPGQTSGRITVESGVRTGYGAPSPVICVRGKWTLPGHIEVGSWPAVVGVDLPSRRAFSVQLIQADGARVNAAELPVTFSSPSMGALSGLLTKSTGVSGRATLSGWALDTPGEIVLTIEVGTLSTELPLTVGEFPHTCAVDDSAFSTADGGCKDMQSGIVWSADALTRYSWYAMIWSSSTLAGNDAPDSDDAGRLDDYDNIDGRYPDNSLVNYCHSLSEGGKTDWRAPTRDEARTVAGPALAALHFSMNTNRGFWTSTGMGVGGGVTINLSTGAQATVPRNSTSNTICVRN